MVRKAMTAVVFFIVALLALLPAPTAVPQEAAPGADPPRRLLLFFETAEGAQLSDPERLLLYESLLVKLGRASEGIAVLEYERAEAPGSDELRSTAAESRRAETWVLVSVGGRSPSPRAGTTLQRVRQSSSCPSRQASDGAQWSSSGTSGTRLPRRPRVRCPGRGKPWPGPCPGSS